MIKTKKPKRDTDVKAVRDLLATYKSSHPCAQIVVRRRYAVCIEIQIIDSTFDDMDLIDRDSMLWRVLEPLPDKVVAQISMLLLLTPKEAKASFAKVELDRPVASRS